MGKGAEPGPYLEVAFDRDEVALEVEEDGVTLDNGWSLVPLVCPTSVRYGLCLFLCTFHDFKNNNYIHIIYTGAERECG